MNKVTSVILDEVDFTIIRELMKNARIHYKKLAKLVDLTDVAVIKRVRRLEKLGVIKKYTAIVDPQILGYSKVSFTGINVKPEKLLDVVKYLKEKKYIKYLAIATGDHNVLSVIWARSAEELSRIHDEIKDIEGVLEVYPLIISEVVKDETYI